MLFLPLLAGMWLSVSSPAATLSNNSLEAMDIRIHFQTRILGLFKTGGSFTEYTHDFRLDPCDWSDSSLDISIRTHSLNLDMAGWEKRMKGEDFFNVDHYPIIRYQSSHIEPLEENLIRIHGTLTVLGITRPVQLNLTLIESNQSPHDQQIVTEFHASTKLKRSDFGMTYAIPFVSDGVKVTLKAKAYSPEKNSSTH